MSLSTAISRFRDYYRRHGLWATIRRTDLAARRTFFLGGMVVFYCDLAKQNTAPANLPSSLKVDRLKAYAELTREDLQQIINVWNPKLAQRKMEERFDRGASLWLIK